MTNQIPKEKTVGVFTYQKGTISGPKEYMEQKGNALISKIEDGRDPVFNITADQSPDLITAILVRLQTDYAGWIGVKRLIDSLKISPSTNRTQH